MARDNGGIIGPANNPTSSTASGVWDLQSQYQAISGGNWPPIPSIAANSLRFNDGSSDNLTQTFSTDGTSADIGTVSIWLKRGVVSSEVVIISAGTSARDFLRFESDDTLTFRRVSVFQLTTSQVFRDVSAWYHIVLAFDTTQATASNRIKMYVNGSQITSFSTETYPSQNLDIKIGSAQLNAIGKDSEQTTPYFDGYMSEVILVDGQQLEPTSFGQFNANGIWTPIPIGISSYGTNGFRLKFENSASLGLDSSPNGNNFTVNNLTSIDQSTDIPTNNFATLNPLIGNTSSTFSEGNLRGTIPPINGSVVANIAVNSGKWYCEFKFNTIVGYVVVGLSDMSKKGFNTTQESNPQAAYYASDPGTFAEIGTLFTKGTQSGTSFITTAGNVYGLMWDADNSILKITDGTNTFQSEFTVNDPSVPISFMFAVSSGAGNGDVSVNFGNPPFTIASGNSDGNGYGNFEYTVPSGYYALCTKNLAEFG